MDINLGEKIKILRVSRGITQAELGEKINVKRNTISQWEKNERTPSFEKIVELSKVLGVTLDYFDNKPIDQTLFELLSKLSMYFNAQGIPEADKDAAYRDIMQLYLKSKEIKKEQNTK